MKQRFSTLDVRLIAHELSQSLFGYRISNIYDLSSRIFLFKFNQPNHLKQQLLVDSGFRCHLTQFSRTSAAAPSGFVSKLRKILKGKRVTAVRQVGWDRVIEIVVGNEGSEYCRKVFLEFFAGGNIVVTDNELNILNLLREVREGDETVDVKVGAKYRTDVKQGFGLDVKESKPSIGAVREVLSKHVEKTKAGAGTGAGAKKAKKGKDKDDLKRALAAQFSQYPVHLLEHVFGIKGFDSSTKSEDLLEDDAKMVQLLETLESADEIFRSLGTEKEANGYIVAKVKAKPEEDSVVTGTDSSPSREDLLYDDFHPFLPSQFQSSPSLHILTIPGFNAAVDEFYSSLEAQKLTSRLSEREETAKRKLETAKSEHEKRLGALQLVQELHIRKAQTIEANTHRVEEACAAVNSLIAQGMDWMDIGKLIESEQKRNNPVASLIKLPLKLYENTVTLVLEEPGVDEEESEEEYDSEDEDTRDDRPETPSKTSNEPLQIDIDLALSPWANARQYYDQKKTAAEKEKKTIQASSRALKSTEKKIEADLKKGLKQEKQTMRPTRRQFFFEKFLYFVSSDGYLVLGGKDPQQNEMLYRRYLKRGDVYIHADLHNATSVIVKNNPDTPDAPIPPSTLSQAGALVVCTSSAWESKAVMAAWWVNASQLSKTVQGTGQYLSRDGDFAIKGEKNFLPPSQLLLGFGVLFLIDEDGRKNHGLGRLKGGKADVALGGNGEASIEDGVDAMSVTDTGDYTAPESADEHVADVDDAADEEAEHIAEVHDNDHSAPEDEDDDHISVTVSEAESERGNPLQVNRISKSPAKTEIESEQHDQEQQSDDEAFEDEYPDSHPDTPDNTTSNSRSSTPNLGQPTKPKSQPLPRGKRTKAARAKAKRYAEQDESDRELAMQLLGSDRGQKEKAEAEAAKREREEKAARDKERRKLQHERGLKAEQERKQKMEADGGQDEKEDTAVLEAMNLDMADLDLLVPVPHPSDHILAALPVIAPWTAIGRFKYKVKLQPGSLKKGKAVREIVNTWVNLPTRGPRVVDTEAKDRERVWTSEIERIKEWRVEEVFGVVPVKGVRVVVAGGSGSGTMKGGGNRGGAGGRGGKGKKR